MAKKLEKLPEAKCYFWIQCSEGDTHVQAMTRDQVLERIKDDPEYYSFFDEMPTKSDTNYWSNHNVLIIKGSIEVPKAVETVKTWQIE